MLEPSIPGYRVHFLYNKICNNYTKQVECVGDDIAWMKFDSSGILRAINPEAGFFGVAPGTSHSTNPNAMVCIQQNTIFTNVAETSDGSFFWEGLENEVDLKNLKIIDWQGRPWEKVMISIVFILLLINRAVVDVQLTPIPDFVVQFLNALSSIEIGNLPKVFL